MGVKFIIFGGLAATIVLFVNGGIMNAALDLNPLKPLSADRNFESPLDKHFEAALKTVTKGENGLYLSLRGLFVSVHLNPDGSRNDDVSKFLIPQFLTEVFTGPMLAIIISLMVPRKIGRLNTALFCSFLGLVGGVEAHAGGFIWYGFPLYHTAFCVAEMVIGWFLAGLTLAVIRGGPRAAAAAEAGKDN